MNKFMKSRTGFVLSAILLLLGVGASFAQTTTFTATNGSWSTASNWSNGVPSSTVDATIQAGSICSLDVSTAACKSLTLSGGNSSGDTRLVLQSDNALSVTNGISLGAPSSNLSSTLLLVNDGSINCSSLSLANTSGSSRICSVAVGNGTLSLSGSCTLSGASSENYISITGTGTMKIGGTLGGSTASYSFATGSTVEFNGSGNQTIPGFTYYYLSTSTGGTKSLGGTTIVNGDLTVQSGSTINFSSRSITIEGAFDNYGTVSESSTGGTNIIKGKFTNYGTWSVAVNETYEFRGGFTNNGTFSPSSGTYTFSTNNQVIDGSGSVTFPVNMNITGAITVTNRVNLTITQDLVGSVSGSTFLNDVNATVNFGRAVLSTGTLDADANPNTVNYNRAGAQTIVAGTYHHLQKNSSGTATSGGAIVVNGDLSVNTGTLSQSTYDFSVAGGVSGNGAITMSTGTFTITGANSHTGTFTRGTGLVNYNGTTQTVAAYTYNSLTIAGSGTKTMAGSFTVNGTLTLSAGNTLALNGSTLTLNGSGSGTGTLSGSASSSLSVGGSGAYGTLYMDGSSSSTRSLLNFTLNRSGGSITLGSAMDINGTVTVTAGTLSSAGYLTILSSASGDARIAQSAGTISGDIVVQKYIAAGSGRRWLHLASPVSGFTWNQLKDDIYVTGPAGQGFDVNGTLYSSVYTYTESTAGDCGPNGWDAPTNVSNAVNTGKGLKVFFRGDRSDTSRLSSSSPPAPNATTLDFTGTVNSGTQNLNITYTNNGNSTWDGWNFVANPYPSAIDWNSASGWTKTRVSGTIYVWNAESGVYATWNGSSGTNGMSSGRIAMGQGFWVKATAASPALSMTEAVKTATATSGFFKSNNMFSSLKVKMEQNAEISDELVVNFDVAYGKEYVKESGDALKLFNSSLNIWSRAAGGEDLVINNYPQPESADTMILGMTSAQPGIYTLHFDAASAPAHLGILLIDSYRNRVIDIRQTPSWKVLINSEAASTTLGRLRLVFVPLATAAVWARAEKTGQPGHEVKLSWGSSYELGTQRYEIEHSSNGIDFTRLGEQDVKDSLQLSPSEYSYLHQDAKPGVNYYRVRKLMYHAQELYSNTVQAEFSVINGLGANTEKPSRIYCYPQPAREQISVELPGKPSESFNIQIFTANGIMVQQNQVRAEKGLLNIQLGSLAAGVYTMRIQGLSFSTYSRLSVY